jgi:L-asparagine transporter-like permease
MLTTVSGAMILINELGITLSNGQGAMIQMTGPSVVINAGALTVI